MREFLPVKCMREDLHVVKKINGSHENVVVRPYRNLPRKGKFRDYFTDLSRDQLHDLLASDDLFPILMKARKDRVVSGLTGGLNVAAAYEHALSAFRVKPHSTRDGFNIIVHQPIALSRFNAYLRRYTEEKTYPKRLAALDRELKKHISGKFSFADIGCSHGVTTEETKKAFPSARVVGFESAFPPGFSLKPLGRSKKAQYQSHDILDSPLKERFHVVRFANVFPHLTEYGRQKALDHLKKSVKEGGIIIVDNGVHKHEHHFYKVNGGTLTRIGTARDPDFNPHDFMD